MKEDMILRELVLRAGTEEVRVGAEEGAHANAKLLPGGLMFKAERA